jgi:NADH-quinone oxidoreductase subunit N
MDIVFFKLFLPEVFFSFFILFFLVFNLKFVNSNKLNYPLIDKELFIQLLFFTFCLGLVFFNSKVFGTVSNNILCSDESTKTLKLIIAILSFVLIKICFQSFLLQKLNFFEYLIFFLFSIFSVLIIISTEDFLLFYMTLEMQSLCFYVLSSFKRNSSFSTEAGLKYFISGSFISGILLLGISFIYYGLGTINLRLLNLLLYFPLTNNVEIQSFLLLGFFLVFVSILFKIGCAPFHFWSPDVYDGAPLTSTIIFSILPKIGFIIFFIKIIRSSNSIFFDLRDIIFFFGFLSVFIGTLFSIYQKKIKKLIIYSSIAQIGFIVMSVSLNSELGFICAFFFLFIYILSSLIVWGLISTIYFINLNKLELRTDFLYSLYLSDLVFLHKDNKYLSSFFLVLFFSIAGIPPLGGFLSKILVVLALVESYKLFASLFLVFISAVSVFYYIRLLKIIFFNSQKKIKIKTFFNTFRLTNPNLNRSDTNFVCAVLCFFLVAIFFSPNFLFLLCEYVVLSSEWY